MRGKESPRYRQYVQLDHKLLPTGILVKGDRGYDDGAGCAGVFGVSIDCYGIECTECALSPHHTTDNFRLRATEIIIDVKHALMAKEDK